MTTLFQVGDVIKSILRVNSIKEGGMGVVYFCELLDAKEMPKSVVMQRDANQKDAIKKEKGEGDKMRVAFKSFHKELLWRPETVDRFSREALIWIALLPHPNIVRAKTLDLIGPQFFLWLEYVDGGDLRSWMGSLLPLETVVKISLQFCQGMEFLFESARIVHRDIKPENILLTRDGVVKITDFGLAKALGAEDEPAIGNEAPPDEMDSSFLTRAGIVLGTIPYMSPEQFTSPASVDVVSDVYCFGVVLHEMLSGRLPFEATTFKGFRDKHLNANPVPLAEKMGLSLEISNIVMKCLAKKPEQRFKNFAELRLALEAFCQREGLTHLIPARVTREELEQLMSANEWQGRGYAYGKLGEFERSLSCYQRSLEMEPKSPGAHLNVGTGLQRLGRHEEALSYFEKEIEVNPLMGIGYTALAFAYANVGEEENAVKTLKKGAELEPDSIATWRHLAVMCSRVDDHPGYEEALSHVESLLERTQYDSPTGFNNEAIQFVQGDELDAALRIHRKAVERYPDASACWYNFAVTLHRVGDEQEAFRCYSRVLALQPDMTFALFYRGTIYARNGDLDAASIDWQRAIESDPEHVASQMLAVFLPLVNDAPDMLPTLLSLMDGPEKLKYVL